MKESEVDQFLERFTVWAASQADLQAAALVGSYACGTPKLDSDLDLVLLVDEPHKYLTDPGWIRQLGRPLRQQVEQYGRLTSLRVWYVGGLEVEFGLTDPGWADQPLDPGTAQVLVGGARLLFERRPLLSPLLAID